MVDEKAESNRLETRASKMIDEGGSDENQLDKAAELLAEAEKLKGPLNKDGAEKKSGSK